MKPRDKDGHMPAVTYTSRINWGPWRISEEPPTIDENTLSAEIIKGKAPEFTLGYSTLGIARLPGTVILTPAKVRALVALVFVAFLLGVLMGYCLRW